MSRIPNSLLMNSSHMSIISNNISNVSTPGYKSIRPMFYDMFANSCYSKNNLGSGCGLVNVIQDFQDGMLVGTGRNLDIGISKAGFFRVSDTQGNIYYTRNGQFLLDKDKNLVNAQGLYLTGQNKSSLKYFKNNLSHLEKINLKNYQKLSPKATSEIKLKALLNAQSHTIESFNPVNSSSFHIKHDMDIYKKNGDIEKISIFFTKKDNNTWLVNTQSQISNDISEKQAINHTCELHFNAKGELISDPNVNISSNDSEFNNIKLNFTDTVIKNNIENTVEDSSQDGYASSTLSTFNIAPNGDILGVYDNEKTEVIGKILLSKFLSPENLQPENGNMWSATEESGKEQIGIAGIHGFGILNNGSLEMSNVDLNKELINMIIAQRNYQSNVQSFKAEDKMINTLINFH